MHASNHEVVSPFELITWESVIFKHALGAEDASLFGLLRYRIGKKSKVLLTGVKIGSWFQLSELTSKLLRSRQLISIRHCCDKNLIVC